MGNSNYYSKNIDCNRFHFLVQGGEHREDWKKILTKTPLPTKKEIAKADWKNVASDWKLPLSVKFHEFAPLHVAAFIGNSEIFQYVLSNSTNRQPKDNYGITPLHIAVSKGHSKIVKILLENKVDMNPKDDWGFTPLHLAACSSLDICKLLIDNGAEKNPKTNGEFGLVPLNLAARQYHEHKNKELVNYLLENTLENDLREEVYTSMIEKLEDLII